MSLPGGSNIRAGGFYLSVAIATMLVGGLLIQAVPTASAAPTAEVQRSFDGIERCGETLNVTLSYEWNDAEMIAVEETPPDGWEIEDVGNGGKEKDGTIKWFAFGGSPGEVYYTISVPSGTRGPAEFFGTYRDNTMSSDEGDAVIQGTQKVDIACDPASTGSVVRSLPDTVTCGQEMQVNLTIEAPEDNEAWIVDERTPLEPVSVDERDHGDSVDGHVKWVATDGGSGNRSFTVQIPGDATEGATFIFRGEYRFDPSMVDRAPVEGDTTVTVSQCENPTPDQEDNTSEEKTPRRPTRSQEEEAPLPSPEDEVEATEVEGLPGSRATYEATVTSQASQGVTILLDNELLPSLDLYPSSDLEAADVTVAVWDWTQPPPDVTNLPPGVVPSMYVDVTVDGETSDHTAVFNVELPAQAVIGEANQSVLAKLIDGSWEGLSAVNLSETPGSADTYAGTVQAPCCSVFMVGFDLISPTITMETVRSDPQTLAVTAEPSDNLGVLQVDILVDDEVVTVLEEEPYTTEVNLDGLEAGDHTITAVAYDLTERYDETSEVVSIQASAGAGLASGLLWALIVLGGLGAGAMVVVSDPSRRAAVTSKLRELGTRLPWATPAPVDGGDPAEEPIEPGPAAEEVEAPEEEPATEGTDEEAVDQEGDQDPSTETPDEEGTDEEDPEDGEDPVTEDPVTAEDGHEDEGESPELDEEDPAAEDEAEDREGEPPAPVTAEADQNGDGAPDGEDLVEAGGGQASREEREEDLRAMLEGLDGDR